MRTNDTEETLQKVAQIHREPLLTALILQDLAFRVHHRKIILSFTKQGMWILFYIAILP